MDWQADGWESLRRAALVVNWTIGGPGTDLSGRIAARPGSAAIGPMSGRIGWPLVEAAMPGLPIRCTIMADVAGLTLNVARTRRSGMGGLTTTAGECARIDAAQLPTPAPALTATLGPAEEAVQAVLTTREDPRTPLVTARLTDADRVVLTIHRAGAALVPGMPSGADSELDLPLATLLP